MAFDLTDPRIKAAVEFWSDPLIMRMFNLTWLPSLEDKYFLRSADSCEPYEYSQEEVDCIKAHVMVTHALTRSS